MHGKREQPRTVMRLKTFNGFHQADIAFLNQVRLIQSITVISARDRNHNAQMRQNQLFCRFQISFNLTLCQAAFFFRRQHGNIVDCVDVLFQIAVSAGNRQCKSVIRHYFSPFIYHFLLR